MIIRNYSPETDYEEVSSLYKDSSTFGGQFDNNRDSQERLEKLSENKPECILVAEKDNKILATLTIFEDGRTVWLYRFASVDKKATDEIYKKAEDIIKSLGHTQVLVYAPSGNSDFVERYESLGFTKGNDFTAFYKDLD
ncbi:GNAT family N-acetyltransferase [Candidatus Nomurabacteria bacterium]|nr:GNAT family N-acetyltransferase [Candidatus Nomurabacteria bacterium]